MDRRLKFTLSAVTMVSAAWVAFGSVAMLWQLLGQALTGGVRLEARAVESVMDPSAAAMMFLWFVAAIWIGAASVYREIDA